MNMVILRGLPGSGKSTIARELMQSGYKRVNKDDLRMMLDEGVWSAENEEIVYLAQIALIEMLLEQRQPIVIDNTHGSERQVRRLTHLAKAHDYAVDIQVISTPIETCVQRDATRPNPVGEQVIRRMAEQPFFKELYK